MNTADNFAPWQELAADLLPHALGGPPARAAASRAPEGQADGAHDLAHLLRVWANARRIAAAEGAGGPALVAAVLLHDCVAVEKSSPMRQHASRLAAERAAQVLAGLGWDVEPVAAVAHAIQAHSFSAGVAPRTLLARVLQDADRLDALGHVGIARCFYTAGRMGSALYDPQDFRAARRDLDDRAFAADHFGAKLLRLGDGFQTATGRRLAAARIRVLEDFLAGLEAEAGA